MRTRHGAWRQAQMPIVSRARSTRRTCWPPSRGYCDGERMINVLIADGSVTERTALARLLRPEIIVMGVHLPAAGGFSATKEVMIEAPTPIVIVCDEHDARQVEMSILA